jgi:prepilin-type N-terminal cleavage/methylation domain-containing protein
MASKIQQGFTLIELLVVISIIGVLASAVISSISDVKSSARDIQRKTSLNTIRIAMEMYHNKYGTYVVSGGGWNNGGNGWLAREGTASYITAVTRVLYNEGFLTAPIVEDLIQTPGFMIYTCGNDDYALSATLEQPTAENIAYIQTTCNGIGVNGTYTIYGKNYAITSS